MTSSHSVDLRHTRLWDPWFPTGPAASTDHVFYLYTPPEVGHAVRNRLGLWIPDEQPVLAGKDDDAFDAVIWTGSVLSRRPDEHAMLYTGRALTNPNGLYAQRIGLARSTDPDMRHWDKHPTPVLVPSGPYYCTRDDTDQPGGGPIWRDPYLFIGIDGRTYAAFAARTADTSTPYNACIGWAVATNDELTQWEYLAPLVDGTHHYSEMEVPQVVLHGNLCYVFFTVHARCYNPAWADEVGGKPNGLHCYVTSCLGVPGTPANNSGSVLDESLVRGLRLIGPPHGDTYTAQGWLDGEGTLTGFIGGLSGRYSVTLDGLRVTAASLQ